MKYSDLLKQMPQDHLSDEWIEWFIETNTKNGTILLHNDAFILAKNWKFVNGEFDPKYSRKYEDAIVLFTKPNVLNITDLSVDLQRRLMLYIDEMHKRNYYTYYNAPSDMSINRLHFQFLAWESYKENNILFDNKSKNS